MLYLFAAGCGRQAPEHLGDLEKRLALDLVGGAVALLWRDEVAKIGDRIAHEAVEPRMVLGRSGRGVAAEKAPEHRRIVAVRDGGEIEQHRERDRGLGPIAMRQRFRRRRLARMDVPDRVAESLLPFLPRKGIEKK